MSQQAAGHNEELQARLQVADHYIKKRKNSLVNLYEAFYRQASSHEGVLTAVASSKSPPPQWGSTSRNRAASPLIRPARSRSPFMDTSAKSSRSEGSLLRCVAK